MNQTFAYRIAIIGNPSCPDIRYDNSQLSALKAHGFNSVQLNIAWGCRPADEPLNLEDILSLEEPSSPRQQERFAAIAQRAKQAKKMGFRTLFHFGAPRVDSLYRVLGSQQELDRQTNLHSIQREEVVAAYERLLFLLADRIPEVDDILMYTFDQEAWLGNEFGGDPLAAGIPLARRLPPFLERMCSAWKAKRPDGMVWWEPWEISAGQIYDMLDRLPARNFGMMLHNNIAEVQMTNPGDRWFRNMVMLCRERDIPVCGELFLTGANEEVEPLQHMAAPAIIYHQLDAMYRIGVQGIKEYYGTRPDLDDPNLHMAGLLLQEPGLSLEEAMARLCTRYAPVQEAVRQAFELENRGLCLFPWDLSWRLRAICQQHTAWHGDQAFWYPGSVAPSPSWKSTRRAIFMMTEDEPAFHPWLTEDLSLRFCHSAAAMKEAASLLKQAEEESGNTIFGIWAADALRFGAVAQDLGLHAEETLAAGHIRRRAEQGQEIPSFLIERMDRALCLDLENQTLSSAVAPGTESRAAARLKEFREDPAAFSKKYFL